MTIEEARTLIRGVEWRGSRPGLSRVRELLHRIGDPQDTLQFVHIAGTNGKGSTAAMLAAVLQAAGYTTGLFTSPFLEQFAERMQVNGQPIPDAELAAACETLQPCIAAMDDQPTEFELVTAAAMLWFQRRGCDIVVLEVGLGGRLDATNVIGAPAGAVIAWGLSLVFKNQPAATHKHKTTTCLNILRLLIFPTFIFLNLSIFDFFQSPRQILPKKYGKD